MSACPVTCSGCQLSWPEADPEEFRKCPECHEWLDHVPEEFRIEPFSAAVDTPFDTTPEEPGSSGRYLLVVRGDGNVAASVLEKAGIRVETLVKAGKAPSPLEEIRLTDWRLLALWLADCAAATAEYEGRLKRTSRRSAESMRNVCRRTTAVLQGKKTVKGDLNIVGLTVDAVIGRLLRASVEDPD